LGNLGNLDDGEFFGIRKRPCHSERSEESRIPEKPQTSGEAGIPDF